MNLADEEIKSKVAEAMGWVWNEQTVIAGILFRPAWSHDAHGFRYSIHDLPSYPESLDACAEFEATLTAIEWQEYRNILQDTTTDWRGAVVAKPKQRCLAYLKTKGIIP